MKGSNKIVPSHIDSDKQSAISRLKNDRSKIKQESEELAKKVEHHYSKSNATTK